MTPDDVLLDPRFTVPSPAVASTGVAWLRSHVVRFSEGAAHRRRRTIVEDLIGAVRPADLQRPGDHVVILAEALGVSPDVAADVRLVASCYQPHLPITSAADDAVRRLVDACGGQWDEETANRIGLLVQACGATAAAIAGERPPVRTTRRIAPDGREVEVDLSRHPFGRGRHACPGRDLADALVAAATSDVTDSDGVSSDLRRRSHEPRRSP